MNLWLVGAVKQLQAYLKMVCLRLSRRKKRFRFILNNGSSAGLYQRCFKLKLSSLGHDHLYLAIIRQHLTAKRYQDGLFQLLHVLTYAQKYREAPRSLAMPNTAVSTPNARQCGTWEYFPLHACVAAMYLLYLLWKNRDRKHPRLIHPQIRA